MTVANLIQSAVALMGGDLEDTTDYNAYAIASTNMMLADLFSINNAILASAAEDELTSIPSVTAVSDTLTYSDKLTRNAMVYGLARDLGLRDNHPATSMFSRLYDEKKAACNIGTSSQVTDYYDTETE
jgi:hypothetical protein